MLFHVCHFKIEIQFKVSSKRDIDSSLFRAWSCREDTLIKREGKRTENRRKVWKKKAGSRDVERGGTAIKQLK